MVIQWLFDGNESMGFSKATLGLGNISWWLTGDFMGLNTVML